LNLQVTFQFNDYSFEITELVHEPKHRSFAMTESVAATLTSLAIETDAEWLSIFPLRASWLNNEIPGAHDFVFAIGESQSP
jgi:hypothetical protein